MEARTPAGPNPQSEGRLKAMNNLRTPDDHDKLQEAYCLAESIEGLAAGLRDLIGSRGISDPDDNSVYSGLILIAHAASTIHARIDEQLAAIQHAS